MDLLTSLAATITKAAPSLTGPVLVVLAGYIIKQLSVLSSNHLAHAQDSLERMESLLEKIHEGIIKLVDRSEVR